MTLLGIRDWENTRYVVFSPSNNHGIIPREGSLTHWGVREGRDSGDIHAS